MRLKDWLDAGSQYDGNDDKGEPMYTLTNGGRLLISFLLSLALTGAVIAAVFFCRLVVGLLIGGA